MFLHMGKNFLITGANGHLGSVIVEKLAKEGNNIAAVVRTPTGKLVFDNVQHFVADLTDDDQAKKLVDDVYAEFKTIDGVVLTAGGFAMGNLETTGKSQLEQMFAVNFYTAYYLVRHLLAKAMQQPNGSRFIFFGARTALDHGAAKNSIAYAFSKALLFQLSGLVNEIGKGSNIVSCIIVPSIIDTQENRNSMPNSDPSKWVSKEDIASMVSFLCFETGNPIRDSSIKMYGNI
jgi:NAD(P)-dependent dehydrogenase (short-subunit alcohol dehydrogenase family)